VDMQGSVLPSIKQQVVANSLKGATLAIALPLMNQVTLGKRLNRFEPRFPKKSFC
jgi:hypothetical protein